MCWSGGRGTHWHLQARCCYPVWGPYGEGGGGAGESLLLPLMGQSVGHLGLLLFTWMTRGDQGAKESCHTVDLALFLFRKYREVQKRTSCRSVEKLLWNEMLLNAWMLFPRLDYIYSSELLSLRVM